jgi:hypothetical protein
MKHLRRSEACFRATSAGIKIMVRTRWDIDLLVKDWRVRLIVPGDSGVRNVRVCRVGPSLALSGGDHSIMQKGLLKDVLLVFAAALLKHLMSSWDKTPALGVE